METVRIPLVAAFLISVLGSSSILARACSKGLVTHSILFLDSQRRSLLSKAVSFLTLPNAYFCYHFLVDTFQHYGVAGVFLFGTLVSSGGSNEPQNVAGHQSRPILNSWMNGNLSMLVTRSFANRVKLSRLIRPNRGRSFFIATTCGIALKLLDLFSVSILPAD